MAGNLTYLMEKIGFLVCLAHLVPLARSQGSGCHVQLFLLRFRTNLSTCNMFQDNVSILKSWDRNYALDKMQQQWQNINRNLLKLYFCLNISLLCATFSTYVALHER